MGSYVEVITELALDGTLTYSVPDNQNAPVGARVRVTVGGRRQYGVVVATHSIKPAYRTLPISEIIDNQHTLLSQREIELWEWVSQYYMCPQGSVFKAAVPSSIRNDTFNHSVEQYVKLATQIDPVEILDSLGRAPAQSKVLLRYLELAEEHHIVLRSELQKECSSVALIELCKKGILEIGQMRRSLAPFIARSISVAAEHGGDIYRKITEEFQQKSIVLLYEKTLVDKFHIFVRLVEDSAAKGEQVLILLPDSFMAEAMFDRMAEYFGGGVVAYHPNQTELRRCESFVQSQTEATVVIGSRSAVLLPMESLGLIIVEQEHDGGYKNSDSSPRLNARDVALVKAAKASARVLLCSECPTVESYYNATQGSWALVESGEYSDTQTSFMVLERGKELLSKYLRQRIEQTVAEGKQALVFQNRRGFSQWVECPVCQHQPMCPHCNVSLTYHKIDSSLRCHYCGYFESFSAICPECGSGEMTFQGRGTERIEQSLQTLFPDAKIERIDYDSTRHKGAFEQIAASIATDCNIIVGTQMVVRGVDFSNVGLVGIVNADNLLSQSDFRSSERAHALLTMISNRAGSGGEVVIQTTKRLDTVIRSVEQRSHLNFYETEIAQRKQMNYPPAVRIIKFTFAHKVKAQLFACAARFESMLRPTFGNRLSPPFEPDINKKEDYYLLEFYLRIEREKSVVKAKEIVRTAISSLRQASTTLSIVADVDPQ